MGKEDSMFLVDGVDDVDMVKRLGAELAGKLEAIGMSAVLVLNTCGNELTEGYSNQVKMNGHPGIPVE
jgi:hypothetical protein